MFPALKIVVDGEIFDTDTSADAIVVGHGVNTVGVMGAGFAKQVAALFPQVKAEYAAACANRELTPGHTQVVRADTAYYVANIASQDSPGRYARVDWLSTALGEMYGYMRDTHHITFDVRLPLIGAGIGGIAPQDSLLTIIESALRHRSDNISTSLYLRSADPVYQLLSGATV